MARVSFLRRSRIIAPGVNAIFGGGIVRPGGGGAPFRVVITGLTGGVAQVGTELTAEIIETPGFDAPTSAVVNWFTDDDGDLATGLTYTPTSDQDGQTLRIRVESDNYDDLFRAVGVIRVPLPVNTDPPIIEIVDDLPPDNLAGFGEVISVSQAGVWTAPGSVSFDGYSRFNGVSYTDVPGTSGNDYTVGLEDSGLSIVRRERRQSTGGDVTVYSNAIEVETFTAAQSIGSPTLTFASLNVGDVVTMTSGGFTGNPTPTTSLQLLADGVPLSGKVVNGAAGDVTIPAGIEGQDLSVRETITSPATETPVVVTGIEYGPVTAPVIPEVVDPSFGEQTEDGLPYFYTVASETTGKIVFVPASLGSLPVAGLAAQIEAETVEDAISYVPVTMTPLDDNATLGTITGGYYGVALGYGLVDGGDDDDVFFIGTVDPLNTLTAPVLTPASGGFDVTAPLLKNPTLTPAEGGFDVGD